MDCADCVNKVQTAITNLEGIQSVKLNFSSERGRIKFDSSKITLLKLKKVVSNLGYEMVGELVRFSLDQIHCRDCGKELERYLESKLGIIDASVAFGANIVTVNYVPEGIKRSRIEDYIKKMGYQILKTEADVKSSLRKQKRTVEMLAFSGVVFGLAWLIRWLGFDQDYYNIQWHWFTLDITRSNLLFLVSLIVPGANIAKKAVYSLKGRVLTIDFLVIMAAIGAILIGTYWEATAVVFLTAFGELLQDLSMERTRKALSELLKGAPKTATVRRNGKIIEIELSELKLGDIAVVKAGEKIPGDGKVVKGFATVNQAPITGESVPVCKEPGEQVFGGTLSEDGYLELCILKTGDDTTISRIIRLVQGAQEEKAPAQQFIEKFAKLFIPTVLALSILTFIISRNVKSSLTLLVVACPCALVISTPVAVVSGLGNAAKRGILIKGGIALEQMGKVDHVVFDKTGTLTLGRHGISKTIEFGKTTEIQVLTLAALAEQKSEHPISKAIMKTALAKGIQLHEPDLFKVHKGKGVYAKFPKKQIIVGNRALLKEYSIPIDKKIGDKAISLEKKALTVFFVAENNIIRGMIGTSDIVRPEAKKVIAELKNLGINTYMLSGDNSATVRVLGKKLGVTKEYGNLLPEDKVKKIKLLRKMGKVAMVGDGINDAPALATADIGIAMGGAGSDLAVETSDITLLSDDLSKIIYGIKLSKKTLSIIKQNTGFALLIVFGLILSAFVGWIGLAVGVIGHEASALIVIANSMRLKGRKRKQEHKGQSIDNCCSGSENQDTDLGSCITASNDEGKSGNLRMTGNEPDTCSDACKSDKKEKQNSQSTSCECEQ